MTQFKQNNTDERVVYKPLSENGFEIDFTGATAEFYMVQKGETYVNAAAFVDEENNTLVYEFTPQDALYPGVYAGEFRVEYQDGTIKHYPENGFLKVTIDKTLNPDATVHAEERIALQVSLVEEFKDEVNAKLVGVEESTVAANDAATSANNAAAHAQTQGDYAKAEYERLKDTDVSTLSAQLAQIAKDLELKKDGTDNTGIISSYVTSLGGNKGTIIISNGTYNIGDNLTIPTNVDLLFRRGGKIKVNTGATLEIKGEIIAQNYEIFVDGGGTINKIQSPSPYNLSWYEGDSINKRYDFAKRDFKGFRQKVIIIPKPYDGQLGSINENGRLFWLVDGELLFDDNNSGTEVHVFGEFKTNVNINSFIKVQGENKPENIYFYNTIQLLVPVGIEVLYGINICDGARVHFTDQVVINGAKTSVKIGGEGQTQPSGGYFTNLQCSFYTNNAVLVDGNVDWGSSSFHVEKLSISSAQAELTDAVLIRGLIRDVYIGKASYISEAKGGYVGHDAQNFVRFEGYGDRMISHCEIGSLYTTAVTNGLAINGVSTSDIEHITVKRIYGAYNGKAFDINDCSFVVIDTLENTVDTTPSVVGSNAYYSTIDNIGKCKVTDNGNYTLINGLGKQSRGGGNKPSSSIKWGIGNVIQETNDKRLYIKTGDTGNDENDHKRIDTFEKGSVILPANATSVTVPHSLNRYLSCAIVTPRGNVGNTWVTTGNTSFTIYCSVAPTSDTTIYWLID